MKITLKESKPKNGKKRFYTVITSRNGRVLCTSEILNSKQAVITNVRATLGVLLRVHFVADTTKNARNKKIPIGKIKR